MKIHVAVDIKTKQAVSLEVTNDRAHDGEMMEPLVKGLKQGSRMPIRTVAGKEVRAYLRDPPGWKKQIGYGQKMVETFFSGFKKLFGEVVHAKRWERMVKEIEMKVWVYNLLLGLTVTPVAALFCRGLTGGGKVYNELEGWNRKVTQQSRKRWKWKQ